MSLLGQQLLQFTSFSGSGNMECARWLFYKMWLELIQPNSFTFAGLLSACAHLNAFQSGKQLHGLVLKYGLETGVVVGSVMVDMYSKCGQMEDAITMFRMMPEKDTISWNGLIRGHAQNGDATKALKLFDEMVHLESPNVSPNDVTNMKSISREVNVLSYMSIYMSSVCCSLISFISNSFFRLLQFLLYFSHPRHLL